LRARSELLAYFLRNLKVDTGSKIDVQTVL